MNLIKFFLLTFCLFNLSKSFSQVTVQTSNLKVNNVVVNDNTINFNNNLNLNISIEVNLTTLNGNTNNTFGNLYLFYKPNSSENEIQVGFAAVTFIVSYPPFVTQTTYTSRNYFSTVNLQASNFFATGGVFYAKYINNNNSSFISSNISVIGGTRTSSATPPFQSNTICCNQTIRKGDKPSIITGSTLLPTSGAYYWVNGSNVIVDNYQLFGSYNSDINSFSSDYLFETTVFKRRRTVNYSTTYSNSITITVVPNPIVSNSIYLDASRLSVNSDGSYEVLDNEVLDFYGTNPKVNLNVLNNPSHTVSRSDTYVNADSFQWQYKLGNNRWADVPNSTSNSLEGFYLSGLNNFEYYSEFYFRRIAKYQNISLVSNVLKVVKRKSSIHNTVCCDELLQSNSTTMPSPSIIIGSTPSFSYVEAGIPSHIYTQYPPYNISNPIYQWQISTRNSEWSNIVGANSKDYLPTIIYTMGTSVKYRRIIRYNYKAFSRISISSGSPIYLDTFYDTYSNFVTKTTTRRSSSRGYSELSDRFVVYPNPVIDLLNISHVNKGYALKLYNSIGQELKPDYVSESNNSVTLNVSSLSNGVYYVNFINDDETIVRKFIKN